MNQAGDSVKTSPQHSKIAGEIKHKFLPRWMHRIISQKSRSSLEIISQKLSYFWNRLVSFFITRILDGIIFRKDFENFFKTFGGHIFFQNLHAAVKFDLFSLLREAPGLTLEEMASILGIEDQPARIMMLGLTSSGLLRKKGEKYYLTHGSKVMLTRQSPKNVIPYVLLEAEIIYKAMPHHYESIKQYKNVGLSEFDGVEATLYQRLAHYPELEKIFQDAMQALSLQTNDLLAKFLDLSDVHHLVDVGGGDGTNILTLAKRNLHLHATVFDLPSICAMASTNIQKHHMPERCHIFSGNCFQHEFPKDADAFLFCHFFTMWSSERDRFLLKKAYYALPKGGRVIIFNMMQRNDGTGPLSAAVGSPYFLTLASGEGMLYSWKEYESWFHEAGFKKVKTIRLPRNHGVIIGTKE